MTAWDILDKVISSFPPIIMTLMLVSILAAVVTFIIGFGKHGVSFIKYGFKQIALDSSLEKRFDELSEAHKAQFNELSLKIEAQSAKIEAHSKRFDDLSARIEAIELNHFGHLKNYLGILNGVLLDKNIIDNETKARLDNELRGM